MKNYFKKTEFILDLLYFYHHGNRYEGQGIMTWNPDEGFHLQAFLNGQKKTIEKVDLGRVQITPKSDICSIRMRPQGGYDWAIIPNVRLSDWNKLDIQNKRLSINFERAVFCESVNPANDGSLWTGSALYETKSRLILSDTVYTDTRINDQEIGSKWGASGIFYEDAQQKKLVGHLIDDKQLELYWKLPKHLWSKAEAWKWAIAIQDVLSIWFGETIWLLQREFTRDTQKITEIRKKRDFSSLGLLSPFGSSKFEKQAFINLTEFFIRDTSKAEVCRRIFWQLVEVSNQHSQQAQELLLSTILEASLRSIDGRPFTAKKDKSWNVGKGLENFFNAYLPSDEWTDTRSRIMREHCYLRDRNAHPDWLFSQGGSFSEAEQAQSLDSMIFLSRFYGYIIFALAGFQGLKPIFPSSHQTWGAAATITVASNLNFENAFPDLHILGEMSDLKKLTKQLSEAKTYHEKTMIWRKFKRGMR